MNILQRFLGGVATGGLVAGSGGVQSSFGQAGAASSPINISGNVNEQLDATPITPGGTAGDYVVAVFNIPANAFDQSGRGLNILAAGTTASNTNGKTAKIIVGATNPTVGSLVSGGTAIASTGLVNTTGAAGGWQLETNIYKYGANGSNTQLAIHASGQSGNVVSPLTAPSLLTLSESGVIPVAVTINAATAASDMTLSFLEIFAMD